MKTIASENLSFQAEVVEMFERDGRRVAKVLVRSFFFEVDANDLAGAHLGDAVVFSPGKKVDLVPGRSDTPLRKSSRRKPVRRSR